ncbi:MAG: type II secretion system protein [Pseudomonadota bacterium]
MKRRIPAFSLLEMALVLSIIGIISAYAIPAWLHARATARRVETDAKLESVIYALAGYVQMHKRLPNPADPIATGEEAGLERSDLTTGILPYRTLAVQESDVKDGFRHWISYSASHILTAKPGTSRPTGVGAGAGVSRALPSATCDECNPICRIRPYGARLDVCDAQGQSLLSQVHIEDFIAFVLVSHGPSGAGSFDDLGQRKQAIGDKLKNFGATSFIDRPITKEYDDRVRWVSRNNLMAMYAKQPCKP